MGDHECNGGKPDPTVNDEAGAHVGEFRDQRIYEAKESYPE